MATIYDLDELQKLCERQRIIIDRYDAAVSKMIMSWSPYDETPMEDWEKELHSTWQDSQNTHTMTGASEQ